MTRRLILSTTAAAALFAVLAGGPADASERCRVQPNETRLSEERIRAILAERGYTQIRSLGEEDGCIEAKGIDNNGNRFEVYLHPVTGEIVPSH